MIVDLTIVKNDGSDRISILPSDSGDNDRVIDIMQYLCVKHKDESTIEEFHHIFNLHEVEMMRDFLTSTLNSHYRIIKDKRNNLPQE